VGDDRAHHGGRHRRAGYRRAAAAGSPHRIQGQGGSIQHSWWHIADGGRIVRRVIHEAGTFGIDVYLIARRELPPAKALDLSAAKQS